MFKLNRIILILVFFLLLSEFTIGGELTDKAETVIFANFHDKIELNSYKLNLDKDLKTRAEIHARQRFFGSFVYYYEIFEKDKIAGYAILDNVIGKVKPITFLLIFNTDYSLKSVDIIKYREQYGGAVANRDWLDQFIDLTIDSQIDVNDPIDGISGATISVKSVIKGVKRLLFFINNLGDDEKDLLVSIE